MTLDNWQFELDGVPFGVGQDVAVSKFTRGGADTRNQDQPSGFGDWVNFGTDRKTPGVWEWELYTDLTNGTDALAALELLEDVWDAEDTRLTPGEVLPLRYRINGRTRVVFGRPRRFSATPQELTPAGRIDVVADFQPAEPGSYSDTLHTVSLSLGQADLDLPGITFPATFPVLWGGTAGSPGTRDIVIEGTRPTALSALITGPVTDPYLIVDGQVLQARGVLANGEQTVLSALPWSIGIYRPDGTTSPLSLDTQARLSSLRLTPGPYEVTFGGIDNVGLATCVVSWRDAYRSH